MKIEILGIKVDRVNLPQALKRVENFLGDEKKHFIVTPNPEMVVLAQKDYQFRKILNSADLAIPDGIGLIWASKILGLRLKVKGVRKNLTERVTGVDLMEKLCQIGEAKGYKFGLLGGKGDTAEKTASFLQTKFPKLRLRVFKENNRIISKLDILFVAYGAPKQEKWIFANLPKIPAKVAAGVGGAFEMIIGTQIRAPKFLQQAGLEWLWRLTLQPWRIKRQLALPVFVCLVLKQKIYQFKNLI